MSGDVAPGATRSFASVDDIDFSSAAGIQELLAVVRKTPMSRSQYNELRDNIFAYKHAGDAPEAKQQIIATLTEVGVIGETASAETDSVAPTSAAASQNTPSSPSTPTPAEPKNEPATEPDPDAEPVVNQVPVRVQTESQTSTPQSHAAIASTRRAGMSRPQPSFGAVTPASTPAPEPATSEQTTPQPAPVPEPTHTPTTPAPTEATPTSPAESAAAPHTPPPAAPQPASSTTPTSAPAPTADQTNTSPVESSVTYGNPLERIKAIKKEVNALVGNPVNLIDAHNEVGREYMNALLDAMKKVNGGATAEVNAAMVRLEAAFTAVKSVTPATPPPQPESASNEGEIAPTETETETETAAGATAEPSPDTPPQPPAAAQEPAIPTPHTAPAPPTAPKTATPSPAPGEPVPAHFVADDDAATIPPATSKIPATPVPSEAPPASASTNTPPTPATSGWASAAAESATDTTEAAAATEQSAAAPESNDAGGFTSMATEKKKLISEVEGAMKEMDERQAQRDAEIAKMDPIMTPDVTSGLNQLLSEWKLFKSSGIFGTGPSGSEHPLYKKLQNMQMSAVIAGRFEGATPEIKQSITDYMNGWRYEEGILHQHGETFEHYLRRVIKKILDKQSTGEA